MIFVTVGTHEQQFNRLVKYMDNWAKLHSESVIIQTGYSTYLPRYASHSDFYSYQQMIQLVKDARIVITHGGPSSFIMPLEIGKIPIVVPRQSAFKEHVNDHQLRFTKEVKERHGTIIVIEDIMDLEKTIQEYDMENENKNAKFSGNNKRFCESLEKIINNLL